MFDASEIGRSGFTAVSDAARLALLNEQLAYAAVRSPYYAKTLAGRFPLQSLSDLSGLPFTDETVLRREGRRLVCTAGSEVARIVSLSTGGSTGDAKRLYFTENDLRRTVAFFSSGMAWMCAPGDACAVLMPCEVPDGVGDLLCRGLNAIGVRALPLGLPENPGAAEEALRAAAPQVLVGFPWQLRLLALRCPSLRPRAVLLSGDYVPDGLRTLIAERWHTTVLSHYGLTEAGYGGAVQHPSGETLYLRRDELIAEVVAPETGRPLPPGCPGELVLTTLRREAMPLLRYRTGDRAVLTPDGNLVKVSGRLAAPPEFYRLQDALAPLPWLWDFRAAAGVLSADLAPDAPPDAAERLSAVTGLRTALRTVPPYCAVCFDRGKRQM